MYVNLLYDMQIVILIFQTISFSISQEFLFSLFRLVSTHELHFRHHELEYQRAGQPPFSWKKMVIVMLSSIEFRDEPFHWLPLYLVYLLCNRQIYFIKRLKSQYFFPEISFKFSLCIPFEKISIYYLYILSSWKTPFKYKYHSIHFSFQVVESKYYNNQSSNVAFTSFLIHHCTLILFLLFLFFLFYFSQDFRNESG